MHGFIHNIVPSSLAGSSGFPTDGERLLVSTASEAAIEPGNVQATLVRVLIGAGRTPEWACGTLGWLPGHGPGVFAGRFACQFWCGRFVSCRGVGEEYCRCLRWPCRKRSEVVSGAPSLIAPRGKMAAPYSFFSAPHAVSVRSDPAQGRRHKTARSTMGNETGEGRTRGTVE